MKKCFFTVLILTALLAKGEFSHALTEDITLRLGGDIRARYEGFTSGVTAPDAAKNDSHTNEYLRIRTRIYGALDIGKDITVNLRLANRVHFVTSSPAEHNNNGAATWEFPDELYIDAANIEIRNLLDSGLSLTIGRQDMKLGNGMIFCEGTPFDQGRSLYSDGLKAVYEHENDKLTAFIFYDSWKDRTIFINDRNRALRSGDVFTAGIYWTHNFADTLKLDTYYMFNDLDDRHPDFAERAHAADASVSLHTAGFRLFGTAPQWMDYSFEAARQFGRDANGGHQAGTMVDARLDFKICDSSCLKPVLGLEFTHLSGDDSSTGRNEGWNPLMTQCPLWGEELLPIMLNGVWSNLNMAGGKFSVMATEKCKLSIYVTDVFADDRDGMAGAGICSGGGRHIGLLAGAHAAYTFNANLSAQAYLSHFMPGNYFDNGQDSTWFRLEITAKF